MKNNPILKVLFVFSLLICLVIPLRSASAADGETLPAFPDFVVTVRNGQANLVRGVYVPGTLALRVIQQPPNDPEFVSRIGEVVTQFNLASGNHVIGLLAHNDLAGVYFSNLIIGQDVRIVYGDGRVESYRINKMTRFQVVQFGGQNEHYVDLISNISYSPQEIFTRFYNGDAHVTFQTCIFQDGNPSWGRLFVTATPVPVQYLNEFLALRILMSVDIAGADFALKSLIWDLSSRSILLP